MALSKRQRGKAIRGTQYGVLVVILVIFAFTANWTKLREAFLDGEVAAGMFPEVITVGLLVALMRLSSVPVYRWVSGLYVEFFRGLPALLVILAIGNGVPLAFGTQLDRYVSIMLALGIVGSAYMAETIRAGIQAVPKGQVEAARSLGMSQTRAMLWIVVPQAFKIILPPLTNEPILLTKDSSLVLFLGSSQLQYELTQFGRTELNQSRSLTPVLVAGICYLIITIPLSYLSRYLERRTGGKKIASPTATEVDTEAVK